jgi:cell division GTPase FtsZ
LLLGVNNNINENLIREISRCVDVLIPIIDKAAEQCEQNAFSFLDKNNFKVELALQYITAILEFVPKCPSIIEPLDIISIFTHYKGIAYVSCASATGEDRAKKVASLALSNIYSMKSYKDCKVLLLTFSGGKDLGLLEINDAAQLIADNYGDEETILFTVVIDESMGNKMRVSIIGV